MAEQQSSPSQSDSDFSVRRWAQRRKDGACLPAAQKEDPSQGNANCPLVLPAKPHTSVCPPAPRTTYVSEVSQVTVRPLEPKVSARERVSLCTGHLRRWLGFLQPFIPPEWSDSPLFFTAGHCGGSSPGYQYSSLASLV